MNIAKIKYNDIADGLGVRTTVFVSGCRRYCSGCQNPEAWDFDYGEPFTEETQRKIFKSIEPYWIQGLTVCGGEPFEPENEAALLPFLKEFRELYPIKDVWIYSGFTYEELKGREMLKCCDVLVDGPFVAELKDAGLAFRGSRNQRIIQMENGQNSTDAAFARLKAACDEVSKRHAAEGGKRNERGQGSEV